MPHSSLYFISLNYDKFRDHPVIQRIMITIRPIVIGFIAVAILKLFKTSIIDLRSGLIAVLVIILTYFFKVNPIYTVIGGITFSFIKY